MWPTRHWGEEKRKKNKPLAVIGGLGKKNKGVVSSGRTQFVVGPKWGENWGKSLLEKGVVTDADKGL